MSMVVIILIYEVNYRSERDLHSCEVTYKAVTKGFICDCLSYFTTAKISFTSISNLTVDLSVNLYIRFIIGNIQSFYFFVSSRDCLKLMFTPRFVFNRVLKK